MTQIDSPGAWRSAHAPWNVIVLLGLSCGAAGLAGAGMASWLGKQAPVTMPILLAASAGAATLVGLALAWLLLLRLAQLDRALAQLASGAASVTPVTVAHGWPLAAIFERVVAVRERVTQGVERERQAAAYRDEVMRQVGEAAAREERNRLARELHDSIKQQLFSIGVSAAAARTRAGESDATDALASLDDIQRSAREAQVEMTALLQQLRPAPLENVGLVEALRDQCEALGYRTGAQVSVTIGALPAEDRLPPGAQEQLFRMAQEALANVARHARAQHVWLRLERQGEEMLFEIRDDGQGFDSASAHAGMGLSNLRERARALAGRAEIQSAPGQGAMIRIHTPLIEPLRVTPEEVERQAAVAATLHYGERWLNGCMFTLQIACALILFDLPIWSVALAIVATGYTYMLGRRAQLEVARLAGRSSEPELALRHRAQERLTWLLVLLGLCLWYWPVSAPRGWTSGAALGGAIAVSAALLALGVVVWERWRRATDRYFHLLPPARRRVAIRRRWDETVGYAVTVGLIIGLGLLFGGWSPIWPPRSATQWSDTASVALLILLCVSLAIELWLSWRWRRALVGTDESEEAA
jgi:signal transduction histidine kinase